MTLARALASSAGGKRIVRSLASFLVLAALGCQPAARLGGDVVEPPVPAPEVSGTNWDGRPFRLADVRGKVAIVFFGYTYCPDVCPFTLAKLKQLHARLGPRADDVAVVFMSVDPHRDTVEKLSQYVPNFDHRFFGVRLDTDELDVAIEGFDLTVQYGQPKDGPGTPSFYYVDHTGTYFVIDREGRLREKFPPNATVEEMLPDIETLLAG